MVSTTQCFNYSKINKKISYSRKFSGTYAHGQYNLLLYYIYIFFLKQSIDFELSEDSMLVLDELHINNYRVINLEDMQERIDKDLPDGYKMKMFPCSLPNTNTKI